MEYNLPSELVKSLDFGDEAKSKVITGVNKLAQAVKSTLGASGRCVIYEDGRGKPVITKDGVTVAESVVLLDPVENMGATLIKEAARNTVKEAGDGTTTATVLAEALIKSIDSAVAAGLSIREIKDGVNNCLEEVLEHLNSTSIEVKDDMLDSVAAISCNNDKELGAIIAEAYEKVGKHGVVLMETSDSEDTYVEIVDGAQIDCGLTSPHFVTNTEKHICELDNPYVLTVSSEIPNIRKIQGVLEHVIKQGRALLIVAQVSQQVKSALLMNKVKGNIKVNIVDPPGFGPTRKDAMEDLATLSGSVGVIKVGADSKVELKEKKDRVEDAIYATKAALQEGIVPGGGVALLNAAEKILTGQAGEVLLSACKAPYETILSNAGYNEFQNTQGPGRGIDVVTGFPVDMIEVGIVDPVLVTKTALKNAVSVALTIMSADCVISNIRINEGS